MDSLYRDNILDHYQHPRHFGVLPKPTVEQRDLNPLCGDQISMQAVISSHADGQAYIDEIAFQGEGCAISLASASMLTEYASGKTVQEVRSVNSQLVIDLLGVPLTPARMKCGLLALEVLQNMLAKIAADKV